MTRAGLAGGLAAAVLLAAAVEEMPEAFRADAAAVARAAEAATADRYPDADAVVVDDRVHTRFEADGSDVSYILWKKGKIQVVDKETK